MLPRVIPHRQMLADAQQIAQMHRRVERHLRMRRDIFTQHINMRYFHAPVDGHFHIAQVKMLPLCIAQGGCLPRAPQQDRPLVAHGVRPPRLQSLGDTANLHL